MFKAANYAMINVVEMKRSVAFYRDTLGLKLKFESPGWSEFDTGTTTIALHGGAAPKPALPPSKEYYAGTCTLGFSTDNIEQTYAELKSRGANFVMPPTDRTQEGIKLATCIDPDGLPISFSQHLG